MRAIERIILIDDNDDDNVFHSIIIEKAGFKGAVVVFDNGPAALEYLRGADLSIPTLVFLDINMPMLDGFEVAERATPIIKDTRTIVIVMLTSSGSPYDRERAGALEVIHGFLQKPLTVDNLRELLRAYE